MLTGKVPPHAVLLDAQSMAGREIAFEHLAAPATIEADDIIAVNDCRIATAGVRSTSVSAAGLPRPTSA
jgi:hypothetical protein